MTNSVEVLVTTLRELIVEVVRDEVARTTLVKHDGYLSTAEAARFASVTPGTIRRWVRSGALTRHEAGARVRVKRDELERLLDCDGRSNDMHLSIAERVRRRFG